MHLYVYVVTKADKSRRKYSVIVFPNGPCVRPCDLITKSLYTQYLPLVCNLASLQTKLTICGESINIFSVFSPPRNKVAWS
jgi:hypothetical protein